MPYAPDDNASLDALVDHAESVAAGLAAVDALKALDKDWLALLTDLKAAREEQEQKRFELLKASRKVRVLDRFFDRAVSQLARQAQADAGGVDKPPYSTLFGAVKSKDILAMGPEKAVAVGALLAEKAKGLQNADNTVRLASAVKDAAGPLADAHAARQKAKEAVLVLAVKRQQLSARLGALAALTQVGILTAFPGDSELVRAVLSIERGERDQKRESDDPPTPAPTPEG